MNNIFHLFNIKLKPDHSTKWYHECWAFMVLVLHHSTNMRIRLCPTVVQQKYNLCTKLFSIINWKGQQFVMKAWTDSKPFQ